MRNELEIIETIERYLQNQLSPTERTAFEQQLAQSPQLQEQLALQQEIMKGIDRASLRQKVKQAGSRYKLRRNIGRWGSAGLIITLTIVALVYYQKQTAANRQSPVATNHQSLVVTTPQSAVDTNHPSPADTNHHSPAIADLPEKNETGAKNWADADKILPAQQFKLDAAADTVIETRNGIILSVPANGFLDQDGHPVSGSVDLVVKEALDAATIIKAGLSSRSGGQLLESGGMFYIDARKNGMPLSINPANAIYAEIPTDTIKPNMALYHGTRKTDGTIDWTDPHPLNHDLVPVDIHLLDFYPPHYLDSLKKWGYNTTDKKFTDSLYYSLAADYGHPEDVKIGFVTDSSYASTGRLTHYASPSRQTDTRPRPKTDSSWSPPSYCGIDPAKIKTIWDKKFQNTLVSTREFEARMAMIHKHGATELMDFYVRNLDKNLSDIDSIAARGEAGAKSKAELLAFYARHDGKVRIDSKQLRKLRSYYEMTANAYSEAIAKTQNDFWDKQAKLDSIAAEKSTQQALETTKQTAANFKEELDLNLKDAFRQLGYQEAYIPQPPVKNCYQVIIVTTGWCNIDRAVVASTLTRTTLNFEDKQTGKKAIITYLPVTFTVSNAKSYDRCHLYLLPGRLSSFMRLTDSSGFYTEKLNQLMTYRLVCIAYKNDSAFFYSLDNIQSKAYPAIALTWIADKELDKTLNNLSSLTQATDLKKEEDFIRFDTKDSKRRSHNQSLQDLKYKLINALFPCPVLRYDESIQAPPVQVQLPNIKILSNQASPR
jgi:hypothetical protein